MTSRQYKSLEGSHVVVFGGSSGIGLATAVASKALGASVTIIGRSMGKLERAAILVGGANAVVSDIGARESVEAAFAKLTRVDHLVITAGGIHAGFVKDTDPDVLLRELNEHVAGSLYAVKAAIPLLPSTGSIVLTGGQFSDRPSGNGTSTMALACRGIEALARSLALELKPVRVNVIAPGYVETALYDALGDSRESILKQAAESLPIGRIGRPEEVADAIIFLLTNGYMNAEVLHIDGGGRFV